MELMNLQKLKEIVKSMLNFEIMFIIRPDLTEREVHNKLFDVRSCIAGSGGKVIKEDVWGTRNLAYEIDGYYKGIYCLTSFDADNSVINILDKKIREDKDIMRHMIIQKSS